MSDTTRTARPASKRETQPRSVPQFASERLRYVWDRRLRESERELLLDLARVDVAPHLQWADLSPPQASRVLLALRDAVNLGNEAAYALGYYRRKA